LVLPAREPVKESDHKKHMMWFRLRIISLALLLPFCISAQTPWKDVPVDSLKDLTDIVNQILNKDSRKEKAERKKNHIQIGVFPAIGYTLQTGFAAVVSANAVIYKKHRKAKDSLSLPSTINASISYSQKSQIILPIQAVLYFNNNNTILVSDWRYLKYPTYTYGLGMNTSPQDSTLLSYQYFKFHQSILFQVHPHVFIGAGYALDYFWNIRQVYEEPGSESDFQKYGSGTTSASSGISLNLLRDTRDNPINAHKGSYSNILLIPRFQFLGSYTYWTSLLLEYRTYLRFPASSSNIFALWSYNWLTLSGKPPYLMLPSTGWDKSFNTGRGYIQGRFRSNNMLDAEMEYRVQLTRNGLFGMVVFANFESFSNIDTWEFTGIAPAGGLGLRIKLNKFSRTNIAIDYGWGRQGSKGFFINLGEAF
jgi:outer membrane protein assembly factor BamA